MASSVGPSGSLGPPPSTPTAAITVCRQHDGLQCTAANLYGQDRTRVQTQIFVHKFQQAKPALLDALHGDLIEEQVSGSAEALRGADLPLVVSQPGSHQNAPGTFDAGCGQHAMQ